MSWCSDSAASLLLYSSMLCLWLLLIFLRITSASCTSHTQRATHSIAKGGEQRQKVRQEILTAACEALQEVLA